MRSSLPRPRVWLDVDTGVDDAFALLFAALSPDVELVGVSCVDGNVDADLVVSNTLTVLDIAGATDVPVARGAERPLLNQPRYAKEYHGEDGLGDLGLSRSLRVPVTSHAVDALYAQLRERPGEITVVALAPLTNIALLLRMYPDAESLIARVVIMGGARGPGNASPTAEFNVWHDPEAAAIVFASDMPITMYGLEVYEDVRVTASDAAQLMQAGTPAAMLAARLIHQQFDVLESLEQSGPSVTLGDYGTLAVVANPDGAQSERASVVVSTAMDATNGQTVFVDKDGPASESWPRELLARARTIDVVTSVDGEGYSARWLAVVGARGLEK